MKIKLFISLALLSLLVLGTSLSFAPATYAAAEVFVPTKTKTESFQEIVTKITEASSSSGAQLLVFFVVISLMVLLSLYYGLARILPVFGLLLLVGGLGYGLKTLQQEKMVITRADAEISPEEVSVQIISETSATLTWKTAKPTLGAVNYGGARNVLDFSSYEEPAGSKSTVHKVLLDGLKRGRLYYYEILSNGEVFTEPEFFFDF